ncbi:MAG: hypothetical protein PHT62_11580 [Desulfotomaculaceae bacterium]|nr:hypothetical protein [Desulfotomaculaceae bacterium]
MSRSFLYMLITVFGSVGVYWLWAFKLGLNENTGLLASTLTAMLLAYLFYRLRKR